MSRFDRPSFVAGLVICALGTVLLIDQLGDLDLGFGWTAPVVLAAVGAILVALGRDRGAPRG